MNRREWKVTEPTYYHSAFEDILRELEGEGWQVLTVVFGTDSVPGGFTAIAFKWVEDE
jgi:hypothetical protein